MKKLKYLLAILLFWSYQSIAQNIDDLAKWSYSSQKINDTTFNLLLKVNLGNDYHIFSFNPGGDGSLLPPDFKFKPNKLIKKIGSLKPTGKIITEDTKDVMGKIYYYKKSVTYTQKVIAKANTTVDGEIYFMVCNDNGCLPPVTRKFSIKISDVKAATKLSTAVDTFENNDTVAATTTASSDTSKSQALASNISTHDSAKTNVANVSTNKDADDLAKAPLWKIFALGFGNGLLAFIMPCIFSMLPITVSFFTKRSKDKKTGLKNAIVYSVSIILIFVGIGAILSVAFTEKTMNELSNSVPFNLTVFALYVMFGLSLLGAFEIGLPSSWSSKIDQKANTTSISGVFFMALVLVIVSFSCTSVFIANLMSIIFNSGNRLGGIIGFLGFGIAIAVPFSLFAFFPSLLNQIAKPGGWLNAVKVVMGFIELALSLKYLSTVDLQYHWHLLDFEVYLSVWIALSLLMGLYLLGVFRMSHDDALPENMFGRQHLSVTRIMFAVAAFSFTFYMLPGLFGAPLKGISGWLPERKTLDFNIYDKVILNKNNASTSPVSNSDGPHPTLYIENLQSELPGVEAFFDYDEGLAAAKATGKPILLDFTGHSCVNCRKMERAVLSVEPVLTTLKKDFIVISLYTDDRSPLANNQVLKAQDGSDITTLGAKNLELQSTNYHQVAQPLYIFLDKNGKFITNAGGYKDDLPRFKGILDEVKTENTKR